MKWTANLVAVIWLGISQSAAAGAIDCSWTPRGGVAHEVSASRDGGVWVTGANPVGAGYGIFRWKNDRFEAEPGGVRKLAFQSASSAWATDVEYRVWRFDGVRWMTMDGYGGEIASGGDPAQVYILGTDRVDADSGFAIYRRAGDHWEQMAGAAESLAVDPDGQPWIIRQDGTVARWSGAQWTSLPGKARHLAIGANGAVWKIGSMARGGGFSIEHWNGASWDVAPGGAVKIAVRPNGQPWVVNAQGSSFDGACDLR